ncbi:MAG TPA: hypothetical protein VHC18_22570 [Amycolatopsis sp.]|nr:hypothetical protein [Amycolatopsis sp.]
MVGERPGDEPEDRGELEPRRPADPAPAAQPAQPPQLDPEQLRQFQQFQQFQDYLRFTEARQQGEVVPITQQGSPPVPPPPYGGQVQVAPPPPPPRPKITVPRWVKRLGGKILSALIILIVLVIAGKLAYNHFFPSNNDDNRPAAETGGGTYHTNKILSTQPYEAVRTVYDAIGQKDPNPENMVAKACGRFREDIQQKFAQDMGYPDCRQAVLALHPQVTNVNDYLESIFPKQYDPDAPSITVDSCDFTISGGPALGVFTVTKVEKGQWLITGHEPGPKTCATPTSR